MEIPAPEGGYPPDLFAELAALEDRHFWFRSRARLFAWAIRTHQPDACSMLEIGCGTGNVLAQLSRDLPGLRLIGSELFDEGLHEAAKRLPIEVSLVRADARLLPFGARFDVVGGFDVLEHIEQHAAVLDEVHRVLRPGGIVVLSVPQHAWLWSSADVRAHHVRRYSSRALHRLLEQAGFEIVRSTSFVSMLLPALMASRLRRRAGAGDALAELRIADWLNTTLGWIMALERAAIERGLRLPFGGSRLVVARRPA